MRLGRHRRLGGHAEETRYRRRLYRYKRWCMYRHNYETLYVVHAFSYTLLLLHDRAGTFASLLYKAEKPSVRPSIRPHSFLVRLITLPSLHR